MNDLDFLNRRIIKSRLSPDKRLANVWAATDVSVVLSKRERKYLVMNKSLLVAALLAVALTACGKKEEVAATLPPPAIAPALPNVASVADTNKAPETSLQPAVAETTPTAPAVPPAESTPAR